MSGREKEEGKGEKEEEDFTTGSTENTEGLRIANRR